MKGFRYILLFLTTFFMTCIYSNRIVYGFTVICQEEDDKLLNGTNHYLNDKANKAWMFSMTAVGMCVGPIPLQWLYKMDTRILIIGYGALSALSSALFPLMDSIGFIPSLMCRFFAGFSQASQLHFGNEFVLRWAGLKEQSLFFSVALSASQIGPLITMILGGETCSITWLGWESTYYILAVLTCLSSLGYAFLYHDHIEDSPFASDAEKMFIQEGKTISKKRGPVPYKSALLDLEIWISLLMFCGYYVGMIVYQQYSPTFIRQVLNFSIRETGYFAAIPMIFAIIIKVLLGKLIDHSCGLSKKWSLALPLIVLESFSAIALFLTGFIDDRKIALFFDMLFASLHFFVPVICSRTIQIVGGEHAHFILNFNMFIAGVIQVFLPGAVHLLAHNNTKQEWSLIFYIITVLIIITTTLYVIFTKAVLAKWAQPKSTKSEFEEKMEYFRRLSLHKIEKY